jgi:hypothetical protein
LIVRPANPYGAGRAKLVPPSSLDKPFFPKEVPVLFSLCAP